jgi:lysyl-tRNA synthetase class 1
LELVPPEILRFLIAQSKPSKAIEFDAGMSLVNLADEYERSCARDLTLELSDDSLSRRRKVQLEDLMGAVRLSSIERNSKSDSSNVSFRHLALLAQTKSNDQLVWDSLGLNSSNPPSSILIDRLEKMRTWIDSPHFPEEMRIKIINEAPVEMLQNFSDDEKLVLANLTEMLENCSWDLDTIASCIVDSAKSIEKSPRVAYGVSYICLMGAKKGPRLAPILVELNQREIVNQFRLCLENVN